MNVPYLHLFPHPYPIGCLTFQYYPPNINQTRCCDQAICTECFVHIKRADPTTTHLVSEPACCPYCMQPNFGITYVPPNWRQGIGAESGVCIHNARFLHPRMDLVNLGESLHVLQYSRRTIRDLNSSRIARQARMYPMHLSWA